MSAEDSIIIDEEDEDEPGPPRCEIKPEVCKSENDWFEQSYQAPYGQVADCSISQNDVLLFQSLLWNHPHDRMVAGYGMTPNELGNLPANGRKGWLVSSHFFWLSRCLNKQQDFARCFVFDPNIRQESADKLLPPLIRRKVTTVILVMSVGRRDNGDVYFGSDKEQGDHWALTVIDIKVGTVYYCDTLGWTAPTNILQSVLPYTKFSGLNCAKQLILRTAHEPNEELHICTSKCTNYPLQKCSDVCGVVAIACIAVAALDKTFFKFLMQPIDSSMYIYLREPTQYSYYLRYVIISWLVRQKIDITKLSLGKDYDPRKPFSEINTECSGIKRKLKDENETIPPKRIMIDLSEIDDSTDDVSKCVLRLASTHAPSLKIVKEGSQIASKLCKENNQWETVCKELVFNNSVEVCRDVELSVAEYEQELAKSRMINSPMLMFKTWEKKDENGIIYAPEHVTVVVLQTDYQREMLRSYCKPCVCVQLTRKSEQDGVYFYICTMSVFVEGLYEVPVAFLISNKYESVVLKYLFECVRKKVGDIETDIFIGDIGNVFYKLWVKYFNKPRKKMYCIWEVMNSMKKHADSHLANGEHLSLVKDMIYSFHFISDYNAFQVYQQAFLERLKIFSPALHHNICTKYFEDDEHKNWALCHRIIPHSAFVPFRRPFLETLKSIGFFKAGDMSRLDVVFHKLLQFVIFLKRKIYIASSVVKQGSVLKQIEKVHEQPYDDIEFFHSVSGEEWIARASKLNASFSVLDSGVESCDCHLRCKRCDICIHKYVCTCIHYILSACGCKHIHIRHTAEKLNNTLNLNGSSSEKKKKLQSN